MNESIIRQMTPWRVSELSFTDADSPALIDVRYLGDEAASMTIAPTGGSSSSKLKVTVTTGSNTYVITPSSSDTNDAEATTIDGLLNEINDIGQTKGGNHEGWEARRRNCLGAQSIDSDDFASLSETYIGNNWTTCLRQDISAVSGAFASGLGFTAVRLVNYDFARRDALTNQFKTPKGYIELGWLDFTVSFSSTAPTIKIVDDEGNEHWDSGDLSTATHKTSDGLFSFENPLVLQGPILVGVHCPAVLDGISTARINWRFHNR